jgi:hypothetical protein
MNIYAAKFMSAALSRTHQEQQYLKLTNDGLWKGPGQTEQDIEVYWHWPGEEEGTPLIKSRPKTKE